jgi:gas vesicle protein
MSNRIEGFVKGFFLGGVIGTVIGILYAPKSGRETRKDINRKAEDLRLKAKREYEDTLKKGSKAYGSAVKQLKHMESATKEKVEELQEKVGELTELGKEAFHDTKDHVTKAVNAAAHAFK